MYCFNAATVFLDATKSYVIDFCVQVADGLQFLEKKNSCCACAWRFLNTTNVGVFYDASVSLGCYLPVTVMDSVPPDTKCQFVSVQMLMSC